MDDIHDKSLKIFFTVDFEYKIIERKTSSCVDKKVYNKKKINITILTEYGQDILSIRRIKLNTASLLLRDLSKMNILD